MTHAEIHRFAAYRRRMRFLRVVPSFAVVMVVAALAACGGGGGGGGSSIPIGGGGVTPTPVATATPTNGPVAGYVSPAGPITLMAATAGGQFGSALLASSADGVTTAEAASTPTEPPSGGTLAQYTATVKETAGIGTSSAQRSPQSTHALQALIADNRQSQIADRFRERSAIAVSADRAQFRTLTASRVSPVQNRRTQAAQGTVGQTRQFKILTSNIGNSGGCAGGTTSTSYTCNVTITATLKAAGAHGNVWVDNASLQAAGEFTVGGEFQTIANDFDGYYATETAAFGPAFYPGSSQVDFGPQCAPDGTQLPQNQHQLSDYSGANGTSIDIVITDALAGTGEGGYYYSANEVPQSVWDCRPASSTRPVSNNTTMFVITGNNYSGTGIVRNETFWLNTDVPRSMSHELQHLLHSRYKYFRVVATTGAQGTFDDAFIEEGQSMLAEDLATDPSPGQHIDTPRYSFSYLLEPSLFSLTSFTGFQPNPSGTATNPPYGWYSNTAGSYGQAYLFARYLYDRFGGNAAMQAIYNNTGSGVTPALAAAGGESFPQLYREFATAVSAQNTSAAIAPYQFSSAITLRGNVDVPSNRTGAQSTRHLVFGGPQPPETFSANQPTGFVTLGPGVTLTTFLVEGGILYLPSANGTSGTSINLTIPGAPSLEGSLVQGTLPTPPPSST